MKFQTDFEDKHDRLVNSEEWKHRKRRLIQMRGAYCQFPKHTPKFETFEEHELELHHKDYDDYLGDESDDSLMLLCEHHHNLVHADIECITQMKSKDNMTRCVECRVQMNNLKGNEYVCPKCGNGIELKNVAINQS